MSVTDDGVPDAAPSSRDLRALLRDPIIGPLAWTQLISALGSSMVGLAIVFVSYRTSESILHTVLVTAAYTLPSAFLAPFAGRLAHRHSRRRIMLWADAAKVVLYSLMAVMSASGDLDADALLVFSLIGGSISAIVYPAWGAFERDLVDPDDLDGANALFSGMSAAAKLVGTIGGGLLVAGVGATAVFVINVVSFFPQMIILARLHPHETLGSPTVSAGKGFRDAVRFVRATPRLHSALVTLAASSLLAAPVGALIPAIAGDADQSASALGLFTAIFAFGAVFVAEAVTRLKRHRGRTQLVELGVALCAGLLVLMGVFQLLFDDRALAITVALVLVPVGLTLAMVQSVLLAITQVATPDELAGEVMAVYGMTYSVLGPLGAVLLGLVAERYDVLYTLAVSGIVLGVFVAVQHYRQRHLGEPPPSMQDVRAALRGRNHHAHPFAALAPLGHHHLPGEGHRKAGPSEASTPDT